MEESRQMCPEGKKGAKVAELIITALKKLFPDPEELTSIVNKIRGINSDSGPEQIAANRYLLKELDEISTGEISRIVIPCFAHCLANSEVAAESVQIKSVKDFLQDAQSCLGTGHAYGSDIIRPLWIAFADPNNIAGDFLHRKGNRNVSNTYPC